MNDHKTGSSRPGRVKRSIGRYTDDYPMPQLQDVVNVETGEIEVLATCTYNPKDFRVSRRRDNYKPGKTGKYGETYKVMFDTLPQLLYDGLLSFDEFGLITACISLVERDTNYVCHPITKQRLSKRLFAQYVRQDKNKTNTILAQLAKKGYIVLEKYKNGQCIRLNASLGFCGSAEKRHELMQRNLIKPKEDDG